MLDVQNPSIQFLLSQQVGLVAARMGAVSCLAKLAKHDWMNVEFEGAFESLEGELALLEEAIGELFDEIHRGEDECDDDEP